MLKYTGTITQTFNRIGSKKMNLTVSPGQILDKVDPDLLNSFLETQLFEKIEHLEKQNKKKGDK